MKCRIVAVGNVKNSPLAELQKPYAQWLQGYMDLTIIEVATQNPPKNAGDKEIERQKEKEGEALLEKAGDGVIIALDQKGKQFSSEAFSEKLRDIKDLEGGKVVFLIGGPNGLSREVRKRSDLVMSFSQMTFPHRLSRVLLLEQLYRAMKIMYGESYHH